ncbi:peptidase MA family metallohydrolase [Chloroflexota bacterium]
MIKRVCFICILVAFISCLLPLVSESEAAARESTAADILCSSSVEADFPLTLKFKISAESSSEITDIRLHYRTNIESFAMVTSEAFIEFEPDTSVETEWSWDMRKTGGLPPGTSMKYWWTIKDASGNTVKTDPTSIKFDDNRHDWQSLTENHLTIYWYEGKREFADELMFAAQEALDRLEQNTGARLKKPAEIYIYANNRDLQGALVFPYEWTGGVAFTPYNIIAIGIEPYNVDWGKSAITHELTHLVVQQMVSNPYTGLPTWLTEGLAMYNEGKLGAGLATRLINAIEQNSLISVRSLSSPFSTDPETAYLSYAQSYSLVEYLVTIYGQEEMLELLMTFSHGSGYDEALENTYGFNTEELNALWRDYVTGQDQSERANTTVVLRLN